MIKMRDLKRILKRNNIILEEDKLYILREGSMMPDHIGDIVRDIVYIADYIPAVVGLTYDEVTKSLTLFGSPRAEYRIQALIDDLRISADRYEEKIRNEKLEIVKQYFRARMNT